MDIDRSEAPPPAGGWLLVLCVLLIAGHPLSFAVSAASAVGALYVRGVPLLLVLVARLVVTAVGIAAGMALMNARPGAVAMTQIALALSAGMDLLVYTTPFFPNNRMPGATPVYMAASIAYHAAWMLYLLKSPRVKAALKTDLD
jgi:hypothetical protein